MRPAEVRFDISEIDRGLTLYGERVSRAVRMVAGYYAPVLESYAKTNASWTDRTSNARQSLHTFVEELGRDTVALYLSHGMNYGIHLEMRYAGRYAIIWPTIEAHVGAIGRMLQGVFG